MNAWNLRIASLFLTMIASAALAQPTHPDCIAQKKAETEKGKLMVELSKINQRGMEKKEECQKSNSAACQQELSAMRAQVNAINAKIKPFQDDIDKFKALCPESIKQSQVTLALYEKVAKEACVTGKGGDPKRCEDALFNIAEINYQADQRDNLANRERYEREWSRWKANEKRGPEPKTVQASFARGLAAHQRYLKDLPKGSRRDVVLYRTAFIYDLMGRSTDAFPLLMEISRNFPNSRQLTASNLRLGEFYFVDKKYDSAIAYYNKVDVSQPGNESIVGLALYHKAEALYQKARYQTAADAFFDYIERADKGAFRGDLRSEAILYLGSCFAEFPESYKDGKKYFSSKGGRRYEDTLFYELAVKHADRDQHDQAIAALEYFLKTYPDYYKAPLAQIKLIEVWDKKKKIEEAQEAREQFMREATVLARL
ncbi:MAG TPA: tetratricopeptide repeat protein, partial [Fibrobacteria bacterium]|nr:tetratricopeptide repeat protein [Fibrobacteria bacterium]